MIIKICGIKENKTLICCEKNNVDFFGMIFYDKSPRNININEAEKLQLLSRDLKINGVGVFVNESIENIKNLSKKLNLKFVQLHGEEDAVYINKLSEINVKIIKKISVDSKNDLKKIEQFKNADYYLFDYKPKINELPGGNAKSFNWDIVKNLKLKKPWFLSGGININNINIIKTTIKPYAIDLSSSMEIKLGIKDNEIINNFMGNFSDA